MRRNAFSLIELLVVVAIISLLMSVLLPSLSAARQTARGARCLANLHALGSAMTMYQQDNHGSFWQTARYNYPTPGVRTYFWGTATQPVDPAASWLLRYVQNTLGVFECPSMAWGSYVPQGGVDEPTTTYGYNAWALDPAFWGRSLPMTRNVNLTRPADLFVFADSAMSWAPAGVTIFQNSTSLDPPTFPWGDNTTATTHFRHRGQANALLADAHAAAFDPEGGRFTQPDEHLGFVGTDNAPHYDNP